MRNAASRQSGYATVEYVIVGLVMIGVIIAAAPRFQGALSGFVSNIVNGVRFGF